MPYVCVCMCVCKCVAVGQESRVGRGRGRPWVCSSAVRKVWLVCVCVSPRICFRSRDWLTAPRLTGLPALELKHYVQSMP